MSLTDDYCDALRSRTGHMATWFPTTQVKPGAIVRIVGGVIEPVGSLAEIVGVNAAISPGSDIAARLTAQAGVSWEVGLDAGKPGIAGLSASMTGRSSFFFVADNLHSTELVGVDSVGVQVLTCAKSGAWRPDWLLVTSVIEAGAFTAVISKSKNAVIAVNASGGLSPTMDNLAAGARVGVQSGEVLVYSSSDRATPLYRAYGIVGKGIIRTPRFGLRFRNDQDVDADWSFAEIRETPRPAG